VLACRRVEKAEAIANEVRELGRDMLVNNAFATGKIKPLMKADVAASWRTPFEVVDRATLGPTVLEYLARSLEAGLTATMVRDRLATYIERFGLAAC